MIADRMTPEAFAAFVEDWVNAADQEDYDAVAKYITQRAHRTLQQKIFGLMQTLIHAWAHCSVWKRYDARNEFTVVRCVKINDDILQGYTGVPCI